MREIVFIVRAALFRSLPEKGSWNRNQGLYGRAALVFIVRFTD